MIQSRLYKSSTWFSDSPTTLCLLPATSRASPLLKVWNNKYVYSAGTAKCFYYKCCWQTHPAVIWKVIKFGCSIVSSKWNSLISFSYTGFARSIIFFFPVTRVRWTHSMWHQPYKQWTRTGTFSLLPTDREFSTLSCLVRHYQRFLHFLFRRSFRLKRCPGKLST